MTQIQWIHVASRKGYLFQNASAIAERYAICGYSTWKFATVYFSKWSREVHFCESMFVYQAAVYILVHAGQPYTPRNLLI